MPKTAPRGIASRSAIALGLGTSNNTCKPRTTTHAKMPATAPIKPKRTTRDDSDDVRIEFQLVVILSLTS